MLSCDWLCFNFAELNCATFDDELSNKFIVHENDLSYLGQHLPFVLIRVIRHLQVFLENFDHLFSWTHRLESPISQPDVARINFKLWRVLFSVVNTLRLFHFAATDEYTFWKEIFLISFLLTQEFLTSDDVTEVVMKLGLDLYKLPVIIL